MVGGGWKVRGRGQATSTFGVFRGGRESQNSGRERRWPIGEGAVEWICRERWGWLLVGGWEYGNGDREEREAIFAELISLIGDTDLRSSVDSAEGEGDPFADPFAP